MSFTQFITFLFIGIGLSFDSFAASLSCSLMKPEIRFRQALPIAFSLTFFQAGFPVIGWLAGNRLNDLIRSVDHWIAFLLLTIVGLRMIWEGTQQRSTLQHINPFKAGVILGLSIATSVDALVVGLSFGFLEMPILFPVVIIGAVTFLASMLGMLFGKSISAKRSRQSLILGGILLAGMGIKIVLEHLWV